MRLFSDLHMPEFAHKFIYSSLSESHERKEKSGRWKKVKGGGRRKEWRQKTY